jgi:hypothetical protein
MGITRMLEESAHQFDIVDSAGDLARFKVVILPDAIPVSAELAGKLQAYLDGGGALLASFESGMNGAKTAFTLKALGVRLKSEGPRDLKGELVRGKIYDRADYVEYVLPQGPLGQGLAETEYALYMRGMDVEAEPGAEVLMRKVLPYFDRTYQHFCSHRQTPSSGQAGGPAVVKNGRVIYFANPIFTEYNAVAPRWEKQMVLNALEMLLPEPLVRHSGPSTLQVTLNEQAADKRWVVHMLHYIPERRSQTIDVIEDVIPLDDIQVSVKVPAAVTGVARVPEAAPLPYRQVGDRVEFTLPRLVGHQMIALSF